MSARSGGGARRARSSTPTESSRRTVAPVALGRSTAHAKGSAQRLGVTARSFAILEHVATARAPVDMLDIISALKLPKATAYRLVDWFVDRGYLAREPDRKRIIVGSRLSTLAFGALCSAMQNTMPHLVLQRLVRAVNETCNIGTLVNGEIIYLDRVEAEHWPLRLEFSVGSRVPLHCTAIGKLFLALTPSARRRRLLQTVDLNPYTTRTITDRVRLEAELRQIRQEQVSFDREEYLVGVVCAAVPVIAKDGQMFAALAVQAPEARMNVDTARQYLPAMRQAAAQLADVFRPID